MLGPSAPEDRFHRAVEELIGRIIRECEYAPEDYVRAVGLHGGSQGVKRLLAEPLSDASLQLWARGRADLTIEALAADNDWRTLFSEQEQSVAARRAADMSFGPAALEIAPETADALARIASPFLPADDIVWGEELQEGIDLCEKLDQVERSLQARGLSGGWDLAHYRRHLADCATCNERRHDLKQALEKFDNNTLKSIRDLLERCIKSLDCGEERARQLLSKEWKESGVDLLPSEAEEAGISDYGWHDPSRTEHQQLADWLRVLAFRAGQLFARTGAIMLSYEESHCTGDNPWLAWRLEDHDSAVARYVRALTEKEFLVALMARNIVRIGTDPWRRHLILPTDGDIAGLDGILEVQVAVNIRDWEKILSQNFVRPTVRISKLHLGSGKVELGVDSVSPPSDLDGLEWGHILHLGWCAALREASDEQPVEVQPSLLKALGELKDRVDSISAAQMPVIDLLERIVGQLTQSKRKFPAEESLREAIGSGVYSLLCPDTVANALAAEQILHDPASASPGLGVAALCMAFECELKNGFLARFCGFLAKRGLRSFPDFEKLDYGRFRPRVVVNGRPNCDLTLGGIRLGLDSPRPETIEFCITEGKDLSMLRRQIDLVREYRNPPAHGGSMSFEHARRIREKLLGIASGDGGAFGLLVPPI